MKRMLRTTALGGALVFMAASAQAMDMKDGFMVGDTSFKIGGYVDLDVHMTEYSKSPPAGASAVHVNHANTILTAICIFPLLTPTGDGREALSISTFRRKLRACHSPQKTAARPVILKSIFSVTMPMSACPIRTVRGFAAPFIKSRQLADGARMVNIPKPVGHSRKCQLPGCL